MTNYNSLTDVTDYRQIFTFAGPMDRTAAYITAKLIGFTHFIGNVDAASGIVFFNGHVLSLNGAGHKPIGHPSSAQTAELQEIATVFTASQKAASEKFYAQVTNRLRAVAGQPMHPVPAINLNSRNPEEWLGPNWETHKPPGLSELRYPNDPGYAGSN